MLGAIRVKERDDLLGSWLVKLAPTEFVLSCALLRGERQDLVGKRYGGVKPERLDAVGFRADQYASSDHEGQQIAHGTNRRYTQSRAVPVHLGHVAIPGRGLVSHDVLGDLAAGWPPYSCPEIAQLLVRPLVQWLPGGRVLTSRAIRSVPELQLQLLRGELVVADEGCDDRDCHCRQLVRSPLTEVDVREPLRPLLFG